MNYATFRCAQLLATLAELQAEAPVPQAHDHHHQQQAGDTQERAVVELAHKLAARGFEVSVRTSLGGGIGFESLRNLRHTFVCASLPAPPGMHRAQGSSGGRSLNRLSVEPQCVNAA